jgi:hypothetical protein
MRKSDYYFIKRDLLFSFTVVNTWFLVAKLVFVTRMQQYFRMKETKALYYSTSSRSQSNVRDLDIRNYLLSIHFSHYPRFFLIVKITLVALILVILLAKSHSDRRPCLQSRDGPRRILVLRYMAFYHETKQYGTLNSHFRILLVRRAGDI